MSFDASANERMRQHFLDGTIDVSVNMDLIGRGRLVEFSFLVAPPRPARGLPG